MKTCNKCGAGLSTLDSTKEHLCTGCLRVTRVDEYVPPLAPAHGKTPALLREQAF
jgi:hypothetical protein